MLSRKRKAQGPRPRAHQARRALLADAGRGARFERPQHSLHRHSRCGAHLAASRGRWRILMRDCDLSVEHTAVWVIERVLLNKICEMRRVRLAVHLPYMVWPARCQELPRTARCLGPTVQRLPMSRAGVEPNHKERAFPSAPRCSPACYPLCYINETRPDWLELVWAPSLGLSSLCRQCLGCDNDYCSQPTHSCWSGRNRTRTRTCD
jgi:hypothetical protein